MCEIAPGVYTAPRMSQAVRDRIWEVLERWFAHGEDAGIVMTWPDSSLPGGQQIRVLGDPATTVVEYDGVYLTRRPLTAAQRVELGLPDPDVPF
jgi:CRISPR-associated protein Cas2